MGDERILVKVYRRALGVDVAAENKKAVYSEQLYNLKRPTIRLARILLVDC